MMAAMLAACRGRDAVSAPDVRAVPPEIAAPHAAYLSVSNLAPEVGAIVVVAANIRLDDSFSVASYVANVGYDSSALAFAGEEGASDMMHVLNPQPNRITVAAAGAEGSSSGVLFELRFRVTKPAGVSSLTLAITELNDEQYRSQVPSLKLSSSLQLDRGLSPRVIR